MAGLVDTFQALSGILVVCPCCGDLLRLADLKLRYTGKYERTVLDDLQKRQRILDRKAESLLRRQERFDEREAELRREAAARGRRRMRRVIHRIDPAIRKLQYHPQDIKTLCFPVDPIVFDGLNDGERVKNVIFIARSRSRTITSLRRSIDSALSRGRCVWETIRVGTDGSLESLP